ncbi:probable glutathione S-transferase [Erythrobacter sp. NAP1]|uniref:glutathione S-transferase family protein n=1 Tax=Erythrobacter sp. NAP1 TaxID=237727 RepID=UPI00006875FE|nr:glutathione S-transferase N-terminal domain-containing protein [Erythrobacter sp. NAP1]EAQ28860.1 probable glutathione S-transferase [Erythrobacter sp. NAP1]
MTDTPPDFLFYGSPVSPFARKAMATAIEKGADFDVEQVNIMKMPDWFLEISPMRRIPVLRDRSIAAEGPGGTIADSSAICAYIERKHPEPAIYPADDFAYGRALAIEEYADTVLAPAGGLGIFRPIFFSLLGGNEPDMETARASWAEKLPPILDYLSAELGDNEFMAGGAFSIADIAVTCTFMQISLVAQTPLDNWPNLEAYFERLASRPSIAGPFAKADGFIRKALPERVNLT